MELIGTFGFRSSKDLDKFATCETAFDASGMPYVAEQACARFSARVVQEVDLGTHVLFVGEVEEAERLCAEAPMTYAYYHQVKGGKTPPKASSYLPGEDAPTPDVGRRGAFGGKGSRAGKGGVRLGAAVRLALHGMRPSGARERASGRLRVPRLRRGQGDVRARRPLGRLASLQAPAGRPTCPRREMPR